MSISSVSEATAQTVAILGRNGAGKTTLLQTLMGEMTVKTSCICLCDEEVTGLESSSRARRDLGYVPQDTPVFMRLSARGNLLTGAINHGSVEEIDDVLALFPKLYTRLAQPAGTLSGGEKGKLGICRALLERLRVQMLDEPTEDVWIGVVEAIAERLSELSREMSILIVEQHLDLVLKIADRIDVMDRGQIVLSMPPGEVKSHPDFLRLLAP